LTWARCECGCGWEGEDEVTQWLIEEAAFAALDEYDALAASGVLAERAETKRLMSRHAELTAKAESIRSGR